MAAKPPVGAPGNYCFKCGGSLRRTESAGRPVQADHKPRCEVFIRAVAVERYANDLRQAAATLKSRRASGDGRRRRYWEKRAEELLGAACSSDVTVAIKRLAFRYETERQGAPADAVDTLVRACRALAEEKEPAPVLPAL